MPSAATRCPPCPAFLAILALVLLAAGPAAAGGDKCQGTKQERKQKIGPRALTEDQLAPALAAYKQAVADEIEGMRQTLVRRIERRYAAHQATGAPFVCDVLVLSGGGPKGAFGSGFLEGWGSVPAGPDARPEFDMVTGVSTGALIAPYAFIGTDEAYRTVADLYASPEENWAKKRGWLFFLPKHPSLFNTCHFRDAVREAANPSVIAALAAGAADDRLLLIGVTNLDTGTGRAIDVTRSARQGSPAEAREEVVNALIASSAIPGVFAPVLMDGMLYADGGATSNLFLVTFPGPEGPFARFQAAHPEAPLPKVRVWIIVNQKLMPEREVVEPKWVAISGKALETLTSTSQRFALNLMADMASRARTEQGMEVELRLVAIPREAPEQATKSLFDKPYMLELQKLGRAMGGDPSSWTTTIPVFFAPGSQFDE